MGFVVVDCTRWVSVDKRPDCFEKRFVLEAVGCLGISSQLYLLVIGSICQYSVCYKKWTLNSKMSHLNFRIFGNVVRLAGGWLCGWWTIPSHP